MLLSILSYPASFTTVTNHPPPLIVTILLLITLVIVPPSSSAIEVIMLFCRLHTPWIPTSQYSGIVPRRPLLLVLTSPFLPYLRPAMLAADFIIKVVCLISLSRRRFRKEQHYLCICLMIYILPQIQFVYDLL